MLRSEDFLSQLSNECEEIKFQVSQLKSLDRSVLLKRKNQNDWNIVEIINHLLLANEFYLEQIIEITSKKTDANYSQDFYNAGWMGQYLAKNIRLKENRQLKSTTATFKKMDPQRQELSSTLDTTEVIDDYIAQLGIIQHQLQFAFQVNLKKYKIKMAVGSWFKLELGNALDFMVGHNARHLVQIQKNLSDPVSLA